MDPNSMEAAETQDINALYEAIASDPYIFDKEDEIPFVNTRLHVAASNGQTHLAIEIWNLKPSLSRKLDRSGLSPLHLALLNGHFEIVEGLIKLDKNLTRVKGREMLTPLHHAAAIDDRGVILTTFLLACPQSIEDLNARGETALHIAAKYCKVRALEVLMGWIRKTQKHWVVDIQDRRGNTILHTAVSTSQPDIVKSVARGCKNFRRLVNDENLEGATAVDIAARLAPGPTRTTIESILRRGRAWRRSSPAKDYSIIDYLISRETLVENMVRIIYFWREAHPMEIRNTVIVVAALITTATFQAVLSPPGGSGGGGGDPGDNSYISGKIVESVVRGYKDDCYGIRIFFVNDKNLDGETAVDIAARLAAGPATTTIKSILRRIGASESSSPGNDCSIDDFLISPETRLEKMLRFLYWRRGVFSMETRNTVLVVAALITAVTFQVLLSPPGGGGGGGDLMYNSNLFGNESYINPTSSTFLFPTTNITQINATIVTSAESTVPIKTRHILSSFHLWNTIAFVSSIAMIILILPFTVFAPLHISLCFMTLGYAFSLPIVVPEDKYVVFGFAYSVIGICAYSVIGIGFLLLTAVIVLTSIECAVDWVPNWVPNIFRMSPRKRKRLQMLHRVLRN